MDRKLNTAKNIAKNKNIKNWQTLEISDVKNKRFSIMSPSNKKISFGQFPYSGSGTFIDHKDEKIKRAWQSRHSKIKDKDGKLAHLNPESASYYSWHILW